VIVKRWLGPSRWRALHLSSYAAFTLIVAHVLISGPDVAPAWARLPIVAGWLATVALWLATTSRLRTPQPTQSHRKRALILVAERLPEHHDSSSDATVLVDDRLCTRSGLCEQLAPHVFRLGVDGTVFHRPTVPFAELELAARAADTCPARAITLAGRPALPRASSVPVESLRRSDISGVPGVRRRPSVSRGDR
jgi:sulfoxide reductase heme-binding subunit YedZ